MPHSKLKDIEKFILSKRAAAVRKIDPRKVVTAEWVRMKCQYGCGGFGEHLTCPPYSPTPERTRRMLDEYSVALLIHWGDGHSDRKTLAAIEREAFLAGYYKAFILAGGPCHLCRECNVKGTCRHPYESRPAMEACGIDVYQTARDAGFPIEVVTCHEDKPNFYTLLLIE